MYILFGLNSNITIGAQKQQVTSMSLNSLVLGAWPLVPILAEVAAMTGHQNAIACGPGVRYLDSFGVQGLRSLRFTVSIYVYIYT